MERLGLTGRSAAGLPLSVFWSAYVVFICALTVFWSISQYFKGSAAYNSAVAGTVLLCATFLLPACLGREIQIRPPRRQLIALVCCMSVAVLSTLLSPNELLAEARLSVYYSILIFTVALAVAFRRCHASTALWVLLVLAIIHVFFLISALKLAVVQPEEGARVIPPFFSNVRHFGYHGYFAACAGLSLAALDQRFRSAGLMIAFASLFGIVLFGSRGALLAWLMFAVVLVYLVPKRWATLLTAMVAIALAVAAVYLADRNEVFHTTSLLDRADGAGGDSITSTYGRRAIWADAISAIGDRPLLGYGPDGFIISACCQRPYVHPHNAILQFALEFGIVGLVSIVWVVIACFSARIRTLFTEARTNSVSPQSACLAATLIGAVAFSMIDGILYHIVPLIHFGIVTALFLSGDEPVRIPAA